MILQVSDGRLQTSELVDCQSPTVATTHRIAAHNEAYSDCRTIGEANTDIFVQRLF